MQDKRKRRKSDAGIGLAAIAEISGASLRTVMLWRKEGKLAIRVAEFMGRRSAGLPKIGKPRL